MLPDVEEDGDMEGITDKGKTWMIKT